MGSMYSLLPVNYTTGVDCRIVAGKVIKGESSEESRPKVKLRKKYNHSEKLKDKRKTVEVEELAKLRKEIDLLTSEMKKYMTKSKQTIVKKKRPKSNVIIIVPYFQ